MKTKIYNLRFTIYKWTMIGVLVVATALPALAREEVYYFINDHLGTPQKLVDQNAQVVWEAEALPFGETVVNEDPDGDGKTVTCNLRFPGQYYDAETGWHYNYHRYYDPTLGRYLREDPVGVGDTSLLPYAYCSNNPLRHKDMQGLKPERDPCKCEEWVRQEADTSWTLDLPKCSCEAPLIEPLIDRAKLRRVQFRPAEHPNAKLCIRMRAPNNDSGQQCCYDDQGFLITGGPSAGTPDKVSPLCSINRHREADVIPWYWCGGLAGWEIYSTVRPPDKGYNCRSNPK